jgi:excisionase family DNA binding protein
MVTAQRRFLTADVYQLPDIARICLASMSTVRHWVATGRLKSIKPGRRRLVLRADLERFLGIVGEE